ncbi:MAG: OsmC family protein [Sphingobacteriales bacterium JAD_PAG50586_3]|nr:MAG: OsmC family protein [Sphingobacteriales bacterium JAD_PAG50586_3]
MAHTITTKWQGKMQFNALVNGHTIIMDTPEKSGGEDNGTIPKPLVLTALSGCTGMDVISIINKKRKALDTFDMQVSGELSTEQPIEYTAIHMSYNFTGNNDSKDAALSAVELSQEKYCGVSHMLKKQYL